MKGGLPSGGVGIWRIGRGGALVVKGSVTPGIEGMSGGSEIAPAEVVSSADEMIFKSMTIYSNEVAIRGLSSVAVDARTDRLSTLIFI